MILMNNFKAEPQESRHSDSSTPRRLWLVLLVGFSLLLIGVLVFRNFLLLDKVLLYKDVGADSINDSYPYFVHLSDYIRREGLPSWSFCVGMGQSLFYLTGSLIWEPIIWLPREVIARALVFQHLFKTVIAGLLFFRFLQLRGLTLYGSLLGSLLLAFSSYMCMGSCWVVSADEVVGFTFLLFAMEQAISGGWWLYIPVAVALLGLVNVFHFYLSAVLLCLYVPARLFEIHGWRPVESCSACIRLAAFAFLGVGLAGVICFGSAQSILNSPRGSGTIANFSLPEALIVGEDWGAAPSVFQLEWPLYYVTAALRPFSTDMLGTGSDFRGWINYFEAPIIYCGLLCLLMVPQAFVGVSRRQRILYGLFLTFAVLPVIFPWFRYLFWLFEGGYFRAFSLFCVFGIITLSMTAFSRYTKGEHLNLWILGATLLLLLSVLYFSSYEIQMIISKQLKHTVAIFLVVYAALLIAGQIANRQSITGLIILFLAAVELVHFDWITVNRPTVTKQELSERVGFNDETADVIRDIKASDKSFFRITKTSGSGLATHPSYNDAMVFNYYGTMSYSSFNNLNYIKFLLAVDAISRINISIDATWSPGLVGHPLLSTFACEKYVLTRNPVPLEMAEQFEFIRRYGSIYLFRNTMYLPFGLVFDRYIPEDVFLHLPSSAKPEALLRGVILSEQDAAHQSELSRVTRDELMQQLSTNSLPDALAERRATAMNMYSFRQTRIEGTVRVNQNAIVVFQTPFDAGWHAFSDGRATPTLKVNGGLLGVALKDGEHRIELRYQPPLLYAGAAVSALSWAVLLFGLWRWPRIRLLS
jgi:membrane protein YfhO